MKIKFNWNTGWMEIDAKFVIEDMKMTNYRKWVKLFTRYGENEQHTEFIQLVNTYIENQKQQCAEWQEKLTEMEKKADGRIPTQLSQNYLQKQVKLYRQHLNGANTKLKRYQTILQVMEGCV